MIEVSYACARPGLVCSVTAFMQLVYLYSQGNDTKWQGQTDFWREPGVNLAERALSTSVLAAIDFVQRTYVQVGLELAAHKVDQDAGAGLAAEPCVKHALVALQRA